MQLVSAIAFKHVFCNTSLWSWLPYHYYETVTTRINTKWTDPTGNIELLEGFSGGALLAHLASLCQVNVLILDCLVTPNRHSIVIFKALLFNSHVLYNSTNSTLTYESLLVRFSSHKQRQYMYIVF